MSRKYLKNVAVALDQLANAVGGGDPDETISSRVGKHYHNTWIESFINFLFWVQTKNHCVEAIEWDEGKNAVLK